MWLIVFLACANNIKALYEAEKSQVMAAPPPVGNNWEPEMRLRFSDQALQALAETAVDGGLLKAEDVEKSKKDNDILKETMMKILNVTKSKGDLKEEYRLIVESSEN